MNVWKVARRVARMRPREIYTRGRQELARRADVVQYRLGRDSLAAAEEGLEARGHFFCDPGGVAEVLGILRRRMPAEAERIVSSARRVVEGRFDLLGYTGLEFGREIDWHLDPVSGKRSPRAPWPSIPFLDFDAVGDHKVIWELSRHQFLVGLAKAYRLTGDERFAARIDELWRSWTRANPYPIGINWASTLEVAFRAISWMWTAFLLEETPAGAQLERDLTREIGRAARFIERYLSTYFSPNTHLLGEGVALLLIGLRYPGLPGADRWRATGWRITLEEAQRQVRADGLHFEQSTYYHVYATDFFLHARLLAARNGVSDAAALDPTLRRMLAAIAELAQAGALPRFGDDDGGRLFDGSRNRPAQMLDPLSTGAALFGDPALRAAAPGLCEETLWLLGPQSEAAFDGVAAAAPPLHSASFPAAGLHTMAAGGPERRSQLFADAGEHGALAGGHGHADALSIQLISNGRRWLIDPGTGAYVGAARERFRGAAAHNTVVVDGREQAEPRGPFAWGPLPRSRVERWLAGPGLDFLHAAHSGYERLPSPVTHHRWIVGLRSGLWLVRDRLEGGGTHDIEVCWRFAADLDVAFEGGAAVGRRTGEEMSIVPVESGLWRPELRPGLDSDAYGLSSPAAGVVWSARTAAPTEFAAVIGFGPGMAGAALRRCDALAGGPSVYELQCGPDRHTFHFAAASGRWTHGEWTSDAALLYTVSTGRRTDAILAGGAWLERAGRIIVNSGRPLECHREEGC